MWRLLWRHYLAWIVYAADYLFSARTASWIGPSDYAQLGLILLWLVVLKLWGELHRSSWPEPGVLDRSGLIPSLLMVVRFVVVPFVKPMAFSCCRVVLVPAVVPVLAVHSVL